MEPIYIAIGLVVGLVIGYVIAAFAGSARVTDYKARIDQMNKRIDDLTSSVNLEGQKRAAAESQAARVGEIETQNRKLQDELTQLKADHASLQKQREKELENLTEQLRFIEEAKSKLEDTFKALSAEALKSNNQAFIDLAKQTLKTYQTEAKGDLTERQKAIEALVQPMKENLDKYQKLIETMGKDQAEQHGSLTEQVKALLDSERSLRDETGKLVHALKAPQVRGHWGEITLRRVVELAGMVEHCDFVEQETTDTQAGRMRPDMIVNLPNRRRIVVDAKSPLKAYMEAMEASSEEECKAKLTAHARQVKARIQELSRKEYWDQFDEAPEFVVLFLPGEQFLGAALQEDPNLLEDGFRQKVILATPTTLIALLKAVAYGWRQEALAENAQMISDLGKQLYERLATLVGHFEDLGKNLDRSIAAYNKAIGSFESRVIVTARKFKELGATAADDIPYLEPIEQTSRAMLPVGYDIKDDGTQPPKPA